MNPLLIGGIFDIGKAIIGKLFPDPAQKAKAELELLTLQQSGALKELEIQMSAIVTEAQSQDKWTSRARPSFLYVMQVCILAGIPMGVLWAFDPIIAENVATGFGKWLSAIPDSLWALFGAGYLGYTGARTWEKGKGFTR